MEPAYTPLVSVVNVTWNGRELLEQHLPSLKNLRYPNFEVIIVDNASDDDSVRFVKSNYPEFAVTVNEANLGTAEGSNVAIRGARGKYIFWVSNDMEFDPYILDHLVTRCESDENIGICTAKMLRIKDGALVGEIDSVGAAVDIFGFPAARGIHETDTGQYDCCRDIFFSFGGAMFIRKALLDVIGNYDPEYLTLGDDIDLSWRAHLAGYRVVAEPKAVLYHRVSATLGTTHSRAQKRYLSERNTLRTLLKNYSGASLLFLLPPYLMILFLEMMFFIAMRRFEIAGSGLRALVWNLSHLKGTLCLRRRVQALRRVRDSAIMSKMLKRPEKVRLFFDYLFNHEAEKMDKLFLIMHLEIGGY